MEVSEESGNVIFIQALAMFIFSGLSVVIILLFSRYRVQMQKAEDKKREMEALHQEQLLTTSIKVMERERKKISEELHDDVGNKLNIVNLWFSHVESTEDIVGHQNAARVLRKAAVKVRQISHNLNPPMLESMGLIAILEEMALDIGAQIGFRLFILCDFKRLETWVELQLYRIIQEFVSNSIKHANANSIDVTIRHTSQAMAMLITDDGKGFDLSKTRENKGLGLKSIETRCQQLKARFKMKSKPGHGTRLLIVISHLKN